MSDGSIAISPPSALVTIELNAIFSSDIGHFDVTDKHAAVLVVAQSSTPAGANSAVSRGAAG